MELLWFFMAFALLRISRGTDTEYSNAIENEMNFTSDLLKQGLEKIGNENHKNCILAVGNTGSGKSTLISWLQGSTKLTSVEKIPGEYVIQDEDHKISVSTTISQTIYPESLVDPDTEITYYDLPGFSDTRNASLDLCSNFFIHKALSRCENVKLAIVVSHPSVMKGVNRLDFLELMTHLTNFVENIEYFENSIVLVATKVDNMLRKKGRYYELVADDVIKRGIADYLFEFQRDLEERLVSDDVLFHERQSHEKAISLIQILTQKGENGYPKIGIFRRPDESGPLHNLELLQKQRSEILRILEQLDFLPIQKDDFGFTISDKSKNEVDKLIDQVSQKLVSKIHSATAEVKQSFELKETETDAKKLQDEFQTAIENLNEVMNGDKIQRNSLDLDFSANVRLFEYLNFLHAVGNRSISSKNIWLDGLEPLMTYFQTSKDFYKFIIELDSTLSRYDIRENLKSSMNLENLEDSDVTKTVEKILNVINAKQSSLEYPSFTFWSDPKIESLRNLIISSLKPEHTISCAKPHALVARGRYIKFSDVLKFSCGYPVEMISIFATDRVFIDTNFNMIKNFMQLNILAPTWEVIGGRKIVLDGKPGIVHSGLKAFNGYCCGSKGKEGSPGFPGSHGGHFYGVGTRFIGLDSLEISARGGDGSDGQDGGDGAPGVDGTDASYQARKTSYGTSGGSGGDGGNGAKGGRGGLPGKVVIWNSQERKYLTGYAKFVAAGKTGWAGAGGRGGRGGRNGRNCYVNTHEEWFLFFSHWNKSIC